MSAHPPLPFVPPRVGGPPSPKRPLCPYCEKEISSMQIKFDPTPAGTYALMFHCPNTDCWKLLGVQLGTHDLLFPTIVPPGKES